MNGFARQTHESPSAFFARLRENSEYPDVVMVMEHAENLMFYGHADPLEQDVAQARAAFAAAYGALRWWRKAAFHLERIVLPRRLFDFSRS